MAWIPDAVLAQTARAATGATPQHTIAGLNNAKVYDIKLFGTRTGGTGRNVIFTVNGVAQPQQDMGDNTSRVTTVTDVAPVGGVITITTELGSPNNNFVYLTATEIAERTP